MKSNEDWKETKQEVIKLLRSHGYILKRIDVEKKEPLLKLEVDEDNYIRLSDIQEYLKEFGQCLSIQECGKLIKKEGYSTQTIRKDNVREKVIKGYRLTSF